MRVPPEHLLEPLNPRQRMSLLLIDEIPDRVVVYPLVTAHAAAIAGISIRQAVTDGKSMAIAQLAAQRYYQHDALSVFSDVGLIAEALGSKLYFREDDVPVLQQPALEHAEQGLDLCLPEADSLPGRYGVYIDAIEMLQREAGDILPIMAFIPAPFTTAALLRGMEDFLVDTLLDPESCHRILELSFQAGQALADLCIEAGGIPMLVDPLASASVISPRIFDEFAVPYLKRFSDYLHRYDFDVFLHICGRSEPILDGILRTSCDLFSCDDVSLELCRKNIGEEIRIIGNLKPTDLLEETPANIEQKVDAILDAAKDNPRGFVLSTGCEVPIAASRENLLAFVREGRKRGTYWGKQE
jgi:uroporphyrinogen decarboxylase